MPTRFNKVHPALKHAGYSATTLVPGEDAAAFEKLHRAVIAEYSPVGALEEDIVADIARLMWRKQNLATFRIAELAVNFREVVHSVRTGNADVAKPQRFAEDRMDTHKNARLTPKGREEMVRAVVDRGMSKAAAARQFNTTPKIVGKWVGRFSADGVDGLRDRSSRLPTPSKTCAVSAAPRSTSQPRS